MAEFIIEMIKAKKNHTIRKSLKEEPYPADYTNAERKTITVAFKHGISEKRSCVRIADSILENPKYAKWRGALSEYKKRYQDDIFDTCKMYMDVLRDYCLERVGNKMETEAFMCKQVGDLIRYMVEARPTPGPERKALVE